MRRGRAGSIGGPRCEVGGRWSEETAMFLAALANAKAQASPFILQNRVKAASHRKWCAVIACGRPECSQLPCWTCAPWLVGETRLQCMRLCVTTAWATWSSCKPSSCLPPRSTRPSTNASSLFRTCSARGFFSSSSRTPVQRVHSTQ